MEQFTMRQKSHRVIRLVSSQFVALMGWIAVQSFFPLSLIGQAFPFVLIIFIEQFGGAHSFSLCSCCSCSNITASFMPL